MCAKVDRTQYVYMYMCVYVLCDKRLYTQKRVDICVDIIMMCNTSETNDRVYWKNNDVQPCGKNISTSQIIALIYYIILYCAYA